jgi:hypothetical protein
MILVTCVVYCTSCDPRGVPGFKQEAKRQDQRITRETEEAIRKSPALQELNRLCTEEIPRPDGFVLVKKSRDFHDEKFLSYGYHSTLDYQSVKRFYVDYFAQHGWKLNREKDDGWGPSEIEFRKDRYQVTISDVVRGKEINYFAVCERLPNCFQEKPLS